MLPVNSSRLLILQMKLASWVWFSAITQDTYQHPSDERKRAVAEQVAAVIQAGGTQGGLIRRHAVSEPSDLGSWKDWRRGRDSNPRRTCALT